MQSCQFFTILAGCRLDPGNVHDEASLFKESIMKQLSFEKNAWIRNSRIAVAAGAVMSLAMAGLLVMAPTSNAMAATKKYAGEKYASASDMNSPIWIAMQNASDYCSRRGWTYAFYPRGGVYKEYNRKTHRYQYTQKYYFECYK